MIEEHDPMYEPDEDDAYTEEVVGRFITIISVVFVAWSGIMVYVGTLIAG